MADKPTTMLSVAEGYAERGFQVYPLIPMGKIPHGGSSGHLDASSDPEEVRALFIKYGINSNIGISLLNTEYVVIDIDLHTEGKSGFDSLKELEDAYEPLPDTFTTETPRNGEHRYYRIPGLSLDRDLIDFRPGVDILGSKVNAAPSVTEKGAYRVKCGELANIAELPRWMIELMVQHERQKQSGFRIDNKGVTNGKKYTATFMEELLSGQDDGNRNVWLTKQFGRMIALGMDYTAAYDWIKLVNQNFVRPPISAKRLNTIVASIAKREQQKYERFQERNE